MNTPSERSEDRDLTRRLRNLDDHLDAVFAAELDDPRRDEAFRAQLHRRATTPPPMPESERHPKPASSTQQRVESALQPSAETASVARSAFSEVHPRESAAEAESRPEEASRVRLKEGSRITGSSRAKMAADLKKRYEKGASIRAIAESTGRSYGFVHRVLAESGVQLRGRGGATRVKKK